jgi:hypothetical protein
MAVSKNFKATPEDMAFFEFAAEEGAKNQETPWYKSYPAAALRGAVEGTIALGQMFSPLGPRNVQEKEREQRQSVYDKSLPIGDDPVAGGIERTAKLAPLVASGGSGAVGTLLRSAIGGTLGETGKQLGLGETGQGLLEAAGSAGPDLAKLIPTKGAQTQLADFARKQGLNEQQVGLTIGQQGPVRNFAEGVASKGKKTVEAFDDTKKALGRVWDTLRSSPEAQKTLSTQQSSKLVRGISNRLSNLPAGTRNAISEDLKDLLKSPMKGDDLINFWQDINYNVQKGERGLGILKKDLQVALEELSPELGKDFKITNELYANFAKQAERMGPDTADQLIRSGETGIALHAIVTGNFPVLKGLIGPVGGRIVAREMIINPRIQNLGERLILGIKRGSPVIAKNAYDSLILELGKNSAEAAAAISDFDMEEFINSLPQEEKEQMQQPK